MKLAVRRGAPRPGNMAGVGIWPPLLVPALDIAFLLPCLSVGAIHHHATKSRHTR